MFLRKSPVYVLWVGGLLLGCLLASAGTPGFGQVNAPGQPETPGTVAPTPPLEGAEPAGSVGLPLTPEVGTQGAEPSGAGDGPRPGLCPGSRPGSRDSSRSGAHELVG